VTAGRDSRRAAEAGSPDAKVMLGWMHEVGRGVPKDLDEAVRWFGLAATRGTMSPRPPEAHRDPALEYGPIYFPSNTTVVRG